MPRTTAHQLAIALAATAALAAFSAPAMSATYDVSVNTSALVGNADGPYYIDLQMNYGSGPVGNTALVDNFNVTGLGSPTTYGTGAVTGNIASGFQLTDSPSSFSNGVYQEFTPGTTLNFQVTLSDNPTIGTPDGLVFGIDDNSTFYIPTTYSSDPNITGVLAMFNLNGPFHAQDVDIQTYQGTGEYEGVTVSVTPVPLPSSGWLLLGAMGGGALLLRRRGVVFKVGSALA